ncbi:aspartyl protease family protein [Polaribacter atrinae]|uniref:aspartyl protease family protein n=2 Tax=Polaribacter atrinae TaxID=1333662 RepID=UPI000A67CE04
MIKIYALIIASFLFSLTANSQTAFRFNEKNKHSQQIKFRLINNLIVIPLEINGKELSFILDTGVNKTILFNLSEKDSVSLLNTTKVKLRGLGNGDAVDAIISTNNTFKIKDLVSNNETVYVILKDFFDLSSKMGTTIHGIIGYRLLKNTIIKVNYKTQRIYFYNPKTYTYKKCKKCETIPFQFHRKKPYIDAKVRIDTVGSKFVNVRLLVDSGGSDAMWLFENSKRAIKTPKRFFNDLLGEGLSGPIYGNRSRVPKFKMGRFVIENPTVSFLDSVSTHNARKFKERNGSVGGGVLSRFKVWIDYPNKIITLKKNGSLNSGFNYNMSGLDIVYNGKQLVKEEIAEKHKNVNDYEMPANNSVSFVTKYSFNFKPSFMIRRVVKNSAAEKAGLLKGDVILKINGRQAHDLKLDDIIYKFQERVKKKIRITIKRNGVKMEFEFRLEKKI